MDLINDYCSSDDDCEKDDDNDNDNGGIENRTGSDHETNNLKKRKIDLNHAGTSTSTSNKSTCTNSSSAFVKNGNTLLKITLLSSPKDRNLNSNHNFERSQPHIQGNWAGSIYISLHQGSRSNSYQQLKQYACSKINSFHSHFVKKAEEKKYSHTDEDDEYNNVVKDEIVIVPHISMNDEMENDTSMLSSDSNDDDVDNEVDNESESESDTDSSMKNDDEDDNDNDDQIGLHISLAKPFYLQKQSIQPFIDDLKRRLSIVQILPIQFDINKSTKKSILSEHILVNDSNTRSFLTIPVHDNGNSDGHTIHRLKELVSIIDSLMVKYGLECYYSDPKFHCSIASWKGKIDWITDPITNEKIDENIHLSDDNGDNDDNNKLTRNKDHVERNNESLLTFVAQGIHCNFGITQKHFVEFNNG